MIVYRPVPFDLPPLTQMSYLTPLQGALKNLRQEISPERRREYLSKEQVLQLLKKLTGKNFGFDAEKWEAWISDNVDAISDAKATEGPVEE